MISAGIFGSGRLIRFAVLAVLLLSGSHALAAPFIYEASIENLAGSDTDNDGYYDSFSFDVYIDADSGTTGSATVAAMIWCTTTGEGFYIEPWIIYADDADYISVHFEDNELTIPPHSALDFEVELWNSSYTIKYYTFSELGPNEPIRADGQSSSGPQIYSADLTATTVVDGDSDGYAETFNLELKIDADTTPGQSQQVAALITCLTTGDSWSTIAWDISGDAYDPVTITFIEDDFTLTQPTELQFKVELYDASFVTKYDEGQVASTFLAEPPGCPILVTSAALGNIRNIADGDADGFLEEFDFDIVVDVDAPGCTRSVVVKIACPEVGRAWTSDPFTISGSGPQDAATVAFSYGDFTLTSETALTFTARVFDTAGTTPLSQAVAVTGDQLKAEASPFTGSLAVTGRVMYEDGTGTPQPLRYAKVELYEGTHLRATAATDANGYYQKTLSVGRPGTLYIRAYSEGAQTSYPNAPHEVARVVDSATGAPYRVDSGTVSYSGNKITIDLIIDNAGSNAGAFSVFDSVLEGYHRARTWLNINVPAVTVLWPDSATFFDGTSIHVMQLDRWDRDVVMHEYGHFLAYTFGFLGSSGGEHQWDVDTRLAPGRTTQEAVRLAFDEGWATFFSIASQYSSTNDANYNDTEDQVIVRNLETDTAQHYSPGEYFESMIACSWWDAFDNHNDPADNNDLLQAPVGDIWSVLSTSKPLTMANFWTSWQNSQGYKIQMHRILRDHQMSFLPSDCTIRVVADTPGAQFVLTEADSEPIEGSAPATFSGLPPGTYTVTWLPSGGYAPPDDSVQPATSGSTITFSGAYLASDLQAPAPNSIDRITATGTGSVAIASATATDETGPVSYRIAGTFYDGSAWTTDGGVSSYAWSTTRPNNWADSGLLENGFYRYEQYVRDSASTPNISSAASATVATLLGPPSDAELTISQLTATSAVVSVAEPPKPSGAGQTAAYFDIITGQGAGAGATDRDYADSYSVQYQNLLPNTRYGWRVRYRGYNGYETAFNPNEKTICTPAAVPGAPTAENASAATIELAINANGNPPATEFAIQCTQTSPDDAIWNGKWLGADGKISADPVWRTAADWAGICARYLQSQTAYTFAVTARNQDGAQTASGPAATVKTSVPGDANGDCKVNIIDLIVIRNYLNRSPDSESRAAAADLNGDGRVNIIDLIKCRNNLQKKCTD